MLTWISDFYIHIATKHFASTLLFKIDFTCISHTNIFITCDVIRNERVSFWIPIGTNNYAILNYMRRDYVRYISLLLSCLHMSLWICVLELLHMTLVFHRPIVILYFALEHSTVHNDYAK